MFYSLEAYTTNSYDVTYVLSVLKLWLHHFTKSFEIFLGFSYSWYKETLLKFKKFLRNILKILDNVLKTF